MWYRKDPHLSGRGEGTIFNKLREGRTSLSGHPRDQKKWSLKRGARLWEVKNVVFVCSYEHGQVSAYERCPLAEVQLYYRVKVVYQSAILELEFTYIQEIAIFSY